MQRTRGIGWALAIGVALTCPAAAAAATPDGSTVLELSPSTKAAKRLAAADVRITASGAADATAGRITLPVTGAQIAATARLDHGGTLTLRKGKRAVTLRSLRTALGPEPRVTAALGKQRITFLSLAVPRSKPLTLDAAAGVAAGSGLRASLSRTAVRALRAKLKAKRLKAGRIGTLSANGRLVPDPVAPPRTQDPAPQPTPEPTPTPEPEDDPVGHTDWVASTLTGSMNLKTFTNYLLTDWPAIPPATEGGPGSVTASNGAARIAADNPYDHRMDILAAAREADGSVRIEHDAQIDYQLPAHSIDNRIVDPEVVILPGGTAAQVFASGHATSMSTAGSPPVPFTDQHVLDLDLTGVHPEVEDGIRTWHDVPAVVSAGGGEEMGYGPGSKWGVWTISVPAAGTAPDGASMSGPSSFAMRPGWISYIKTVPPAGTVTTSGGTTEASSGVFEAQASGTLERGSMTGSVNISGAVRYQKPGHGIDVTIADTQVAFAGDTATISALVTQGAGAPARIDMATIDLAATTPTEDGDEIAWTDALAAFTTEGAAVFGGSYAAGSEYGKLTLTLGLE